MVIIAPACKTGKPYFRESVAAMTRIDTVVVESRPLGWGPIAALAQLTADLFGGRCHGFIPGASSLGNRIWGLRPRLRGRNDAVLLAFLPTATEVNALRNSPLFRAGYRMVAVWLIDSFWDDRPLRAAQFQGIDLIGIIRRDEIDHYRRHLGQRVMALNWGADVLGAGSEAADRSVDLLRVGRQPPAWSEDAASAAMAREFGLRFAGRPEIAADPARNQQQVMAAYRRTKYVLAHSNLASDDVHTHKVKEYITGRWTDALACGASVAGQQPQDDDSYRRLLWPEAVLHFDHIDLRHNMQAMAEAVATWTPAQARHNHLMALRNLDWRHSLKRISDAISVPSPALDADLARIAARCDAAPTSRA